VRKFLKKTYLKIEQWICARKTKKDILFPILSEVMLINAIVISRRLEEEQGLRLWFCFYEPERFKEGNLKKRITEHKLRTIQYGFASKIKWDLIIYCSHGPYFRHKSPKIYAGHGLRAGRLFSGKPYRHGSQSRDENNRVLYDKMFVSSEPDKEIIRKHFPDHYPTARVVGNLIAEEMVNLLGQSKDELHDLPFDRSRKTIMITSSWGEHCLVAELGVDFMAIIRPLLVDYNIIFAMHPNNFVPVDSFGLNWNELLNGVDEENFYVIKEGEIPIKYLASADLLITDYTSMGLYYVLSGRPIIFVNNKNVEYEQGAPILKLRDVAYCVDQVANLKEHIPQAFETFDPVKILQFAKEVNGDTTISWERHREEIYDCFSN